MLKISNLILLLPSMDGPLLRYMHVFRIMDGPLLRYMHVFRIMQNAQEKSVGRISHVVISELKWNRKCMVIF